MILEPLVPRALAQQVPQAIKVPRATPALKATLAQARPALREWERRAQRVMPAILET